MFRQTSGAGGATTLLPSFFKKIKGLHQEHLYPLSADPIALTFIGMPGCGKSHWATRVAKRYSRPLLELDALMEQQAGETLLEIKRKDGENRLAQLENDAMRSVLDTKLEGGVRCVVSPGGSCVYAECAPQFFTHPNNLVVFLDVALPTIMHRTENMTNRGILMGDHTPDSLKQYRDILYDFYADVRVDMNVSLDQLPAKNILDKLF